MTVLQVLAAAGGLRTDVTPREATLIRRMPWPQGSSRPVATPIQPSVVYASESPDALAAQYDGRNPGALKQLVAGGTKLHAFPKDVMDASFKAAMALFAELSATNPAWKKIYDDYSNFRRDQNLWFRFTEARFDSFMQTQKL